MVTEMVQLQIPAEKVKQLLAEFSEANVFEIGNTQLIIDLLFYV